MNKIGDSSLFEYIMLLVYKVAIERSYQKAMIYEQLVCFSGGMLLDFRCEIVCLP